MIKHVSSCADPSPKEPTRLLYYAPFTRGGMADYSHHQASALSHAGVEVTLLCPAHEEGPWHRISDAERPYQLRPILQGWRVRPQPALIRKLLLARDLLLDAGRLAKVVEKEAFPRVLFAAYNELFAPIWSKRLHRLAQEKGTIFGAVIHDPKRSGGIGPYWWHRRSMAAAYSILREAFVHAPIQLDTAAPMPQLRTGHLPSDSFSSTVK